MTMQDATFNNEMLETLLGMDEGPTLDFKREQYPFEKETAEVKSEHERRRQKKRSKHVYEPAF